MAPVFEYQARSRTGKKINGTITADDPSVVASQLKEQGYFVTAVNKKMEKKDIGEYLSFGKKVKIKDLAVFSQQFAVLINSGIPLVDAITLLQSQTSNKKLKEVLAKVQEDVETGSSLSEAFKNHPDVFPDLYYQLIKAGEAGGVLDHVLSNLASHYEKQDELNGKVKSALYYPVTILCITVLAVVFLVMFIVPTFVEMFSGLGAELPLPTRMLLGASGFLQSYWWVLLGIIVLVAYGVKKYNDTTTGRYRMDTFKLKLPVIGNMLRKIAISRFTGTLSVLLNSGVDLLTALNIVEDIVGNNVFARVITESRASVREGVSLSEPLEKSEEFPGMVVQMIKVGEETGQIDQMLQKVSSFYDREVESAVEGSISMIEPVMMVFLAIIVGFVVISIALPMFDMFSHIG